MNPPPNGLWRIPGGNEYGRFWDGSRYLATTDINTTEHHNYMMQNPEYARAAQFNGADIDQYQSEELSGVEVVGNKIKKLFSSETYNTPRKRSNAVFIGITIAAVVFGLLVYFKKIKI